jgi:Ca2+-binding RTX toxin-like protein
LVSVPPAPDCAGPVADIAVGDSVTVDCSYTTVEPTDVGTRTNTAEAESDQTGVVTSNTVSTTVASPNPAYTVTKAADQATVTAGDDIDFHITVENTGNVTLTGIAVSDLDAPDCTQSVPDLDPGEDHTVDCTYTTVDPTDVGTFSNTAVVTVNETGEQASNQVDVTVEAPAPALTATKAADQATVVAGEDIDYHITIENTGNVTLTGIAVTDDDAPDCAGPVDDLDPGEDVTVDCTYTTVSPDDVGTVENAAAVTSDQTDPVLTDIVATTVVARAPALTVEKTADQSSVLAGADIDYHVTVENTGNVTLTGLVVTDPKAPDCAGALADLDPGDDVTVDCTYTTTLADAGPYTNVATVDSAETAPVDSAGVTVTVAVPRCAGQPVTVLAGDPGTPGADVMLGTSGPDTIDGLGGNDLICGIGGGDVLRGGLGNDRIYGGEDADQVLGDAGADVLYGNNGADTVGGGTGNDLLDGGDANDTLTGGGDNDVLTGGAGVDVLNGSAGNDVARGTGGNDTVRGQAGDDRLEGNVGNDLLEGAAGNDRLFGGPGGDTCRGGTGTDMASACEVRAEIP